MLALNNPVSSVTFPVKLITSFTEGELMLNVVLTIGNVISPVFML